MSDKTMRPSRRLRQIIGAYPNLNAVATAWGVQTKSLTRWVEGEGNISLDTAGRIQRAVGLGFDELFEAVETR